MGSINQSKSFLARGSLLQEVTAGVYHGRLLWEVTAGVSCGILPLATVDLVGNNREFEV